MATVAVHCGAGSHRSKDYGKYNRLCRRACRKAVEVLRAGGGALEAVNVALTVLEDDPLTNSGYGSNLTSDGCVEGDASIMDGKTLVYGGCGAVRNVKNPIHLAYRLCLNQSEQESLPLGLIPPALLVGKGGAKYAKSVGLKTVSQKSLISAKAQFQYEKYKKKLVDLPDKQVLDTVGAVCVDKDGHVAAGCSSGGIILKRPGRVGQAAIYGSGVWADSFDKEEGAVAVCTSGCGEHLIRTHLAKQIAEDLKTSPCPTLGLSQSITDKFLNSRYLQNVTSKLCGALVLHVTTSGDTALLWGHTTESMSIGYMRLTDDTPQAMVSELPRESTVGHAVNVSGVYTYNKDSSS